MKIRLNENEEIVKTVQEGLKRTGGYCPCRVQRTEEFKCMCREFREQIRDPEFEGYCHCMLYYKEKQKQPGGSDMTEKTACGNSQNDIHGKSDPECISD